MTDTHRFTITHPVNAPRDFVWQAWTNPALIAQWFGPKGFTCKVLACDVRPGGSTHSYLKSPDGHEMWGKFVYRDVTAPSHLSWVHSFADAKGNVARHPFSPNWPLTLFTTIALSEEKGKTLLTLTWEPLNATETERHTFAEAMDGMKQGWGGTFDQLDAFCAEQAAA